jgi:hypothetical protein
MRIYATTLWLSAERGPAGILGIVRSWLRNSRREDISLADLQSPGKRTLPSGSTLEVASTESEPTFLYCLRYSHADASERGRRWVTDFGMRAVEGGDSIECSVNLFTDDLSARVGPVDRVTRPGLVRDLIKRGKPTPKTPGVGRESLTAETAESIKSIIHSPERLHPLVIVSPTEKGEYLADVHRLKDQLDGLADTIVIPPGEDTWHLAGVIGNQFTPYLGAISLIYTSRKGAYLNVGKQRLVAHELEFMHYEKRSVETEILSLLTDRTNLVNSWRHISLERVQHERTRRSLHNIRHNALNTDALQQALSDYEEIAEEQDREIGKLRDTVEQRDYDILAIEEKLGTDIRLKDFKLEQLQYQLDQTSKSRKDSAELGPPPEILSALKRAIAGSPVLADALTLVEHFFADRVVVLKSAWSSAEDSESFARGGDALDLLFTLAGPFREALAAGKPMSEAKAVFPKSVFAATENTNLPKEGRRRRTFSYRGEQVEMLSHLKIGIKDSAAETLRIHFSWDFERQVIVIGHCGRHLDFG